MFHLPTGEATITLEDVYRTLRISIRGEWVLYHPHQGVQAITELYEVDYATCLGVEGYEIQWECLVEHNPRWDAMLCTLIVGVLIPNC